VAILVHPSRPLDQIPCLDEIAKILHQEDVISAVVFDPKDETKSQHPDINEATQDPHLPSPRHLTEPVREAMREEREMSMREKRRGESDEEMTMREKRIDGHSPGQQACHRCQQRDELVKQNFDKR
jgi:hypothetical protein